MTRLDGEKKSPLPWIIGLIVLALLAAGIYYFAVANKGANGNVDGANSVGTFDSGPNGLGPNSVFDNTAVDNAASDNTMDSNSAMMGGTDTNMADSNAMMNNSVMDSNSAMMDNSAMMGNSSTMMDNATNVPMPALTPAAAPANGGGANDTIATRSKTIKTDDKTVIYKKSAKADGELVRNKTIVPEPVQAAKKNQ